MEGCDSISGNNNGVGEGASWGGAADPSAPSDGGAATAAAGSGGVVDNTSSPAAERLVLVSQPQHRRFTPKMAHRSR